MPLLFEGKENLSKRPGDGESRSDFRVESAYPHFSSPTTCSDSVERLTEEAKEGENVRARLESIGMSPLGAVVPLPPGTDQRRWEVQCDSYHFLWVGLGLRLGQV